MKIERIPGGITVSIPKLLGREDYDPDLRDHSSGGLVITETMSAADFASAIKDFPELVTAGGKVVEIRSTRPA